MESTTLADGTPGSEWTLEFQSADPAALTNVEASVDYCVLVTLEPAGSTMGRTPTDRFDLNFSGITGWDAVEIANPGMNSASLELSGITPTPQPLLLPAVQKVREAARRASAMQLALRNTSSTAPLEIVIELHGVRFQPRSGTTPPWRSSQRFTRTLSPIWEVMTATLSTTATTLPGPLTFVLQPRGESALFPYPPNVEQFSLTQGAAGPLVNLSWSAPADFYRSFRVLHSPDMTAGSWIPLATVPAGTAPQRTWTGPKPAGSRGFFKVDASFTGSGG